MTKESQVTTLFQTINFKEDFLGGGETGSKYVSCHLVSGVSAHTASDRPLISSILCVTQTNVVHAYIVRSDVLTDPRFSE